MALSGSGEASLYKREETGEGNVIIETITMDNYFEKEGWPVIQLIKIDVEGAEKLALEGAKELFKRNPDLKLFLEFGPNVMADARVSPEELFNTLTDVGFTKISVIQTETLPMTVPGDIQKVVAMAKDGYVNLLCEQCGPDQKDFNMAD